jgi:hypothetical protein
MTKETLSGDDRGSKQWEIPHFLHFLYSHPPKRYKICHLLLYIFFLSEFAMAISGGPTLTIHAFPEKNHPAPISPSPSGPLDGQQGHTDSKRSHKQMETPTTVSIWNYGFNP